MMNGTSATGIARPGGLLLLLLVAGSAVPAAWHFYSYSTQQRRITEQAGKDLAAVVASEAEVIGGNHAKRLEAAAALAGALADAAEDFLSDPTALRDYTLRARVAAILPKTVLVISPLLRHIEK